METRTLKLTIEYDGTCYAGWQRQKNADTIQGSIEDAIAKVIREKVRITGAGRTDAGVHALAQVAHFSTRSTLPSKNILKGANSYLPRDIVIRDVEQVDSTFNARRQARLRWYRYQIMNRSERPALYRHFFWHVPRRLDISRMEAVAEALRGHHDFRAFRSQLCTAKRTKLTMEELSLATQDDVILIDFKCRSFLHNMVRIIVGLMVVVGGGKLPLSVCEEMIKTGKRSPTVLTAPPSGLFLMRVYYDLDENR